MQVWVWQCSRWNISPNQTKTITIISFFLSWSKKVKLQLKGAATLKAALIVCLLESWWSPPLITGSCVHNHRQRSINVSTLHLRTLNARLAAGKWISCNQWWRWDVMVRWSNGKGNEQHELPASNALKRTNSCQKN